VTKGLPALTGSPIFVSSQPCLTSYRGQLLSGRGELGTPVHAASFIRRREIILETQLLAHSNKLRLIVTHEVFHFIWARLGNQRRASYTQVVMAEMAAGARGELGESAHSWKQSDAKIYICESFCDTGAWLYSGVKRSSEFTLSAGWKQKRRAWFVAAGDRSQGFRC
jgi:hypothetical protein